MAAPIEHSSILIKLSKADRIYHPSDVVTGVVTVNCFKGWSHQGVKILVEGNIALSVATRVAGMIDAVVPYGKPVAVMKHEAEIAPAGKFNDGVIEIPFSFPVKAVDKKQLYESYHGAFVSVIYSITAECDRGVLKKSLRKESEFIIELPGPKPKDKNDGSGVSFNITPESLSANAAINKSNIPNFKISGKLHSSVYSISQPFAGEVKIESSSTPLKSIDLQLVRVESVITDTTTHKEATEIQTIQVAEGDVCRNLLVPLYMVFPRLFCCSTTKTPHFCVEFEINLMILFADGYMITENFPITIYREV